MRVDERPGDPSAAGRPGSVHRAGRPKPARPGSPVRATILHGVTTIEAMGDGFTSAPRARMILAVAPNLLKPWMAT
jgi:hypothetical protein